MSATHTPCAGSQHILVPEAFEHFGTRRLLRDGIWTCQQCGYRLFAQNLYVIQMPPEGVSLEEAGYMPLTKQEESG